MLKEESSGERQGRTEESQGEEMQGSGILDPGDLMETSPVSKEAAIDAGAAADRLIEACSLCEALMDVTDQPPLSQTSLPELWAKIACPPAVQQLSAAGTPWRRRDGLSLQGRGP